MSVGTLAGLVERCAEQLAPVEQQIKAALSRAEVLHQDETGLYVAGQRHWMHASRDGALDLTQRSIPNGAKWPWMPSAFWRTSVG
jgi:hypothetical protein